MPAPLLVAVAQPHCVSYDVAANAASHAATIGAAAAQVVVFPELSLTGYELSAPTLAVDDPRLTPIVEACAETGSVAFVGAPVAGEGGRSHIGMLAVDGAGARAVYRKMYLGGGEGGRFTVGAEPTVFEAFGWRLGLAICKDIGISQHAADTAALGIDAYVAGVVESDADLIAQRAQRVAAMHRVWVAVARHAPRTELRGFNRRRVRRHRRPIPRAVARRHHSCRGRARSGRGHRRHPELNP